MKDGSILNTIFNNINRWLEFAEKKNAYIFSFFSLMVIFTPFVSKLTYISSLLKISLCIFYALYTITIICTLLSLFPTTKISEEVIKFGMNKKLSNTDNLLFWGDICKYSSEEFKSEISEKYNLEFDSEKLSNDLIDQIIVNARITRNKMEYFKRAVVLTCIAMVQFAICFSISLFI
jgi:hypothetical protein